MLDFSRFRKHFGSRCGFKVSHVSRGGLSRRSFLAGATSSPLLLGLGGANSIFFALDGDALCICAGNRCLWRADPSLFGGRPVLQTRIDQGKVVAVLKNSVFAGSSIRADCELQFIRRPRSRTNETRIPNSVGIEADTVHGRGAFGLEQMDSGGSPSHAALQRNIASGVGQNVNRNSI
jgi:hypothetical protein